VPTLRNIYVISTLTPNPKLALSVAEVSKIQNPKSKIQNPNWHGKIDLQFIKTDRLKTELWRNYACAPLKLQRPFYPEGDICHAVLLHSAGGMVGGDRLSYKIDLAPESRVLVTTAAATKIYRSNGSIATQQIEINVGDNACLEWLPQETILFDRAEYRQDLRVNLGTGAIWCSWEIVRLGRSASDEQFTQGRWQNSIEVWQHGKPLWIDRQRIDGDFWHSLQSTAAQPILAVFVILGCPVTADLVAKARGLWQDPDAPSLTWGVTALPGGLICRYRGNDRQAVQQWFIVVWDLLREQYLDRRACIPRVWQI
jgi:urease accessory protein